MNDPDHKVPSPGIEEKTQVTYLFLHQKIKEYEYIKVDLESLKNKVGWEKEIGGGWIIMTSNNKHAVDLWIKRAGLPINKIHGQFDKIYACNDALSL